MSFESLPPELLLQTLRHLESPKQLHSLISASPACLRVFSKSSGSVFASLIRNVLHPVALPEIKAIANTPEYTEGSPDAFRDRLPAFFRNYFAPGTFNLPNDSEQLMRLYCIAWHAHLLTNSFFKHSMHQIRNTHLNEPAAPPPNGGSSDANSQPPIASLSPSDYEVARLQRAFLRFELYCRVFPVSQLGQRLSIISGRDQFRLFLSRLPPWEVEEISSAHQYLVSLLADSLNALEDRFVDAVLAADSAYARDERREDEPRRNASGSSGCTSAPVFSRHSMFAQVRRTDAHIFLSCIASLGIELVHSVTHADGERLGNLIRENYPGTRDFLPEALMHAPPSTVRTVQPDTFDNSDLTQGNFGYYMFKSVNMNTYLTIIYAGMVNLPLRDLGYVFWDSERFQDFGVYRLFMRAKTPHTQDVFTRFMRRSRRSVEERLKDVRLPPGEIERIERRFGSLRDAPVHVFHENGDESD